MIGCVLRCRSPTRISCLEDGVSRVIGVRDGGWVGMTDRSRCRLLFCTFWLTFVSWGWGLVSVVVIGRGIGR
jgi:hypothetical protein